MTVIQTISWIFLATAISSEKEPTDFKGISMIADGINHSIPSQKELQSSILWLNKNGLIAKNGKKYTLTLKGKMLFEKASTKTNILLKIWNETTKEIEKTFANNGHRCTTPK